jgi:hypothetical protein
MHQRPARAMPLIVSGLHSPGSGRLDCKENVERAASRSVVVACVAAASLFRRAPLPLSFQEELRLFLSHLHAIGAQRSRGICSGDV